MKDTQILSAFHDMPPPADDGRPAGAQPVEAGLVFDACQTGVVLRAVLFVEVSAGVGVAFFAHDAMDWVIRLAMVTGGALPATLSWLLLACVSKRVLARLPPVAQYMVAVLMGAVAGLYGCGMLAWSGIMISPPWVASAFSGALLSGILVAALVMRSKGRMPADTSARLAELQSRIRPHFLFNTLNSAIALVRAEPAKAEALLEDLSDLFREALKDSGEPVRLAQEIELAQRYLAIEQVRFGDRLRVQWALDPDADGALLPPLLLQPLVENAVRHGVEPSDKGADVRISTQRRGSMVVIKVTNTVPNGQGEQGQGLALRNVRERLDLLHDVHSQFRSALKDGVFQVRMEVPI
ncbi:histidine kinase [Rhodoferax sp. AJA081-3]|uniref:sensor histidine kinase n=1 Tax=Rhodoferax sp. AJA081-3 TaxID=2752316 RepID=UPI001ADEC697|nr:histidine kinase [Rhodoferax sp. AJA081-3]QTN29814.1 histidine kinase [Rhodoferax sp. AJA081-3]